MSCKKPGEFSASILGVGILSPSGNISPVPLPGETGLEEHPAFQCLPNPAKGKLPVSQIRRLGRVQRMALHVAHDTFEGISPSDIVSHRLAVAVGTGLGEIGETTRFLENMIKFSEAQPMPTRFVNSVHNSLASQIAINFACRGENHTFTQDFVSFELALWQSLQALHTGRADAVLACGADELSPYAILAGLQFGWWDKGSQPNQLLSNTDSDGALPGEGAAALLLAKNDTTNDKNLPKIAGLLVRPLLDTSQSISPAESLNFIQQMLQAAHSSLTDVDLILVGANGVERNDCAYRNLIRAVQSAKPGIAVGVYKHKCGEFCSAAALATALAARTLREQQLDTDIQLIQGQLDVGTSTKILVCHLYSTGYQSAILVTT